MPQARSLSCVCARRACPRTRSLVVRSSRVSWASVCICLGELFHGGPPEGVSVGLSFFFISVSRQSPSSIADFLTLSLKASLCLSPSVRLSSTLCSALVPPLSPFFLRSSFSRACTPPPPLSPAPAALARTHTLSLSLSLTGRLMVSPGPFIGQALTGLDLTPPLIG